MNNDLFILHRHSFSYLGYSFIAFIVLLILDLEILAFFVLVFFLFSAFVFRNPEKALNNFEENALLSLVDGTVTKIEELEDSEYGYKLDITSSYMDVSILRAPFDAKVKSFDLTRGARLSNNAKNFSAINENAVLVLENKSGQNIKVVHRLTQSFAPLFIDTTNGSSLSKTSRYGVMLCGVTSIYIPKSFKLNVNVTDKVSASETLLGYFL